MIFYDDYDIESCLSHYVVFLVYYDVMHYY